MKTLRQHFTPAELATRLTYDPETGELRWIDGSNHWSGKVAGSLRRTKYININMGGKNMLAHRVAWALHFGEWPTGILDHINGCKSDNRISNLRPATLSQNHANSGLSKRNKLGCKGVYETKGGRWQARIFLNKKTRKLGIFETVADARLAYEVAAKEAYGEFFKASWEVI